MIHNAAAHVPPQTIVTTYRNAKQEKKKKSRLAEYCNHNCRFNLCPLLIKRTLFLLPLTTTSIHHPLPEMRRTSSHSCSLADCRRYRNAMLTWAWTWRTVEFKINNLCPPKARITFLNFEQYKNKFWENQLCLHFFSSEKQSRLYYFIILFYILLYYFYHVAELQSQKIRITVELKE